MTLTAAQVQKKLGSLALKGFKMIRVFFLFLILSALIYFATIVAQKLTGKQFFKLTKIAGLVIISSSVALVLMILLTQIF
jgi:hypothetical protein